VYELPDYEGSVLINRTIWLSINLNAS